MTPKYPSVSLGPAVKNNWLVAPLLVVPPPNSIPHSPLIVIAFPSEFLIPLTNLPVVRLNPLLVPAALLLPTAGSADGRSQSASRTFRLRRKCRRSRPIHPSGWRTLHTPVPRYPVPQTAQSPLESSDR